MRPALPALAEVVGLTLVGVVAAACGDSTFPPRSTPPPPMESSAPDLPCNVASALEKHCSLCHGKQPISGAPMPLVIQADFQKLSKQGTPYYKLARERILEASPKLRMPPSSQDEVPAAELAILDAWLSHGAPKYTGSCEDDHPDSDDGGNRSDGDDGGRNAGDGDGDQPPADGGSKDDSSVPEGPLTFEYPLIKPEDCEHSIELRAFDESAPSEGFPVGESIQNSYECFDFEVPYDGTMQALQIEPIIDDARVVHHWLVYDASGSTTGKQYYNCTGAHPSAQLLAGWAAGRGTTKMPKGVGLRLPQKTTAKFTLEIHYNNAGGITGIKDRSGARICATSKLQPNEAAVSWLGTEDIAGMQAMGSCHVQRTATIISSWPHMHFKGIHMKVELQPVAGAKLAVLDKPFSFDNQRAYNTPLRVGAGDVITTTCDYDAYASFGPGSEEEMCYNFVLAYPAGALSFGTSVTGASATCLQ